MARPGVRARGGNRPLDRVDYDRAIMTSQITQSRVSNKGQAVKRKRWRRPALVAGGGLPAESAGLEVMLTVLGDGRTH
jgi:hypothetical protein